MIQQKKVATALSPKKLKIQLARALCKKLTNLSP